VGYITRIAVELRVHETGYDFVISGDSLRQLQFSFHQSRVDFQQLSEEGLFNFSTVPGKPRPTDDTSQYVNALG
jgi:hypothetical protein